jgi:hypothetical protein
VKHLLKLIHALGHHKLKLSLGPASGEAEGIAAVVLLFCAMILLPIML